MGLRERIESNSEPVPFAGCWLWLLSVDRDGYGRIGTGTFRNPRTERAHRVSYRAFVGDVPRGLHVLHRCDTPACVNPAHLFVGTDAENAEDRERKGRGRRLIGEASPHAKLTELDVRRIRSLLAAGVTHRRIAALFGVASARIGDIARGATWRHV